MRLRAALGYESPACHRQKSDVYGRTQFAPTDVEHTVFVILSKAEGSLIFIPLSDDHTIHIHPNNRHAREGSAALPYNV